MRATITDPITKINQAAEAIALAQNADVLLINCPIRRPLDLEIIQECRRRRRREQLILILVTEGGDAHVAYRVARAFQEAYKKFTVFVTGYCKSAGTLVAVGAHELVIADTGELGPLDVQMSKPDELLQMQSGLTATAALATLHSQAFQAFEHFFLRTVTSSGNTISTRTATQIAAQLTCGLFSPIYGHVDPMHVGEAGRALAIAVAYGRRLQAKSGNFTVETLEELTSGYPSHGFIIDREEVTRLFKNVRPPDGSELALADALGPAALDPSNAPESRFVAYLSSELPPPQDQLLPGLGEDPDDQTPDAEPVAVQTADLKPGPVADASSTAAAGNDSRGPVEVARLATAGDDPATESAS
jgi:Serine dehydrogenase proteinase